MESGEHLNHRRTAAVTNSSDLDDPIRPELWPDGDDRFESLLVRQCPKHRQASHNIVATNGVCIPLKRVFLGRESVEIETDADQTKEMRPLE